MSGSSDDSQSSSLQKSKDNHGFIIALIITVPYMIYFGIALLYYKDSSLVEKLAVIGSLVSAIVGYYFGQRPVKELTARIGKVEKEKEETVKGLTDQIQQVKEDKATTENKLHQFMNDFVSVASEIENYKINADKLKKSGVES